MMTEISLNVLDVTENSVKAGATLIRIIVDINSPDDRMTVSVEDNGCGMTPEQLQKVTDPFFTTRTTRKVGLGVPFFKQAAELTGGTFEITSAPGVGTKTSATFVLSSIDRMPLGDMVSTIHQLIVMHQNCDFLYTYKRDGKSFILDTREFRETLGDVPFDVPEVSLFIKDFLNENTGEVNEGSDAL